MVRDNPFKEIEELLQNMGVGFEMGSIGTGSVAVDVRDDGDAFVVTADVPGVSKEDVEVTLSGQTLQISADHESASEVEEADWIRRERHHSSTSRSVRLPEPVDDDAIEASYANGVLTVTLPKQMPEEGTQIEVE